MGPLEASKTLTATPESTQSNSENNAPTISNATAPSPLERSLPLHMANPAASGPVFPNAPPASLLPDYDIPSSLFVPQPPFEYAEPGIQNFERIQHIFLVEHLRPFPFEEVHLKDLQMPGKLIPAGDLLPRASDRETQDSTSKNRDAVRGPFGSHVTATTPSCHVLFSENDATSIVKSARSSAQANAEAFAFVCQEWPHPVSASGMHEVKPPAVFGFQERGAWWQVDERGMVRIDVVGTGVKASVRVLRSEVE